MSAIDAIIDLPNNALVIVSRSRMHPWRYCRYSCGSRSGDAAAYSPNRWIGVDIGVEAAGITECLSGLIGVAYLVTYRAQFMSDLQRLFVLNIKY